MAQSWHFPRWRSLLMQGVMWIVLGGSVALAALLDVHLRRAQVLDLSNPIVDGPVSFQFPAGWKTWTRQADGDAIAHVAQDFQNGVDRSLIVMRQRVPHQMSPAQYMIRAAIVPSNVSEDDFKGVLIDGWPGQTVRTGGRRISLDSAVQLEFSSNTAIILPDNQAVVIRMVKNSPFEQADQRLYQQILDQVSTPTTRPTDGGTIRLTDHIKIDVPAELSLYPHPDPLRLNRVAATLTDTGGWVSAEFIPVVVSGALPSLALQSGIAAREQLDFNYHGLAQRWINAEVTAQSTNHWTITPQDSPSDVVAGHCVAHLLFADGSEGVVVILTAQSPADFDDLDHLWDMLAGNIQIEKSPAASQALENAAALLRTQPTSAPGESWWMWTYGSTPLGFTHGFVESDLKSAIRYTVRRNWNGTVTAVDQQWGTSDTGTWASMRRFDAEANLNDPLVTSFVQNTTVTDRITTVITSQGGRDTPVVLRLSPAFVLSRNLPDLLARVGQSPMAFWTDRFPGIEGELLPSPLLLLAHRVADADGFRCVEAQVNGTGQISRWYFAGDGSLDHADFPGDLHLRTSSESEIESSFAGDGRLTIQPH